METPAIIQLLDANGWTRAESYVGASAFNLLEQHLLAIEPKVKVPQIDAHDAKGSTAR